MSDRDNITLPREVVEKAIKAFENGCPPTCENGMIDSGGFSPWGEPILEPCPACLAFEHLRAALATPKQEPVAYFDPQKREFYWARPTQIDAPTTVDVPPLPLYAAPPTAAPSEDIETLRRENERLRDALKLALNSHGRMLLTDPPQDPWKVNRVDEVIRELLQEDKT